jgi:hypothetical protein
MAMQRQPSPVGTTAWGVPRSQVWHCVACGGYQINDMLVTQPLMCTSCGTKGLVAAAPADMAMHLDLPILGGTG